MLCNESLSPKTPNQLDLTMGVLVIFAWLDEPSASEPLASLAKNHKRFFAEANIALPGLSSDNSSVDDLFEALVMQRGRLKEMQQLREW